MKNTTKIISVILSVMLLVCGIVAVSSSAEDAPSVEIVSKNLSYDSNISILFAVKTANTEIAPKLNIYDMVDGTLTYKKTVDATFTPANSLAEVGFADAYIFYTPGIVAKAIDTEIYVEAVITDGDAEYKSAVERYSIVEYCHEMNAQKNTTLYTEIIEYGATVQKMLEADGKFEGSYATDYKYVTIEGGTLDGKYDSGIYLKGETVTPSAAGVTLWIGSDGTTVDNNSAYTVGDTNVSFKAGRRGLYDFENNAVGSLKGVDASGAIITEASNGTGSIVEDTVYDKPSKVMHYNPTTTDRSFYRTERDTAYNAAGVAGLEFSVDFKIELGADGFMPNQLLTFRGMWGENTSNKEIMAFQIFVSETGNINIKNVKNSGEGTVVLDGGIGVGSYVNLKFIFTPAADGTFEARIYVNGSTTPQNGKVFKTTYPNTDTFANTDIMRVAFKDYGGARDDDFYFDNLFFGYIKADELP